LLFFFNSPKDVTTDGKVVVVAPVPCGAAATIAVS
jgi:hypothetical protein